MLVTAGILGRVGLFFSTDVFAETRRNLSNKYPAALPALDVLLETFADWTVDVTEDSVRRAAEVVASKDAPILAGASTASVDYLATYDQRHLIGTADTVLERFGIVVATPAEILHALEL
jgi:predicted nucleic acid-binding protein